MRIKALLMAAVCLFLTTTITMATASYEVKVKVDGLACPFCAYGLEKKLMEYDPLLSLKILVDEGYAVIQHAEEVLPDLDRIKKLVKKGGFTPKEILITVSGKRYTVAGPLKWFLMLSQWYWD